MVSDPIRVKSFETMSIEAKRFAQAGEKAKNVRVDQNSSVTEMTKLSENSATVGFRFIVNYSNRGFIKMEGQIIVEGEVDPLIQEWSSGGSMPVETANIVHNVIVSNCLPTALIASREIKLPPPFPLPRVNIQKKGQQPPSSGVEVA